MSARLNRHELGQRFTKADLAIWLALARRSKNLEVLWREAQAWVWQRPLNYHYWGY